LRVKPEPKRKIDLNHRCLVRPFATGDPTCRARKPSRRCYQDFATLKRDALKESRSVPMGHLVEQFVNHNFTRNECNIDGSYQQRGIRERRWDMIPETHPRRGWDIPQPGKSPLIISPDMPQSQSGESLPVLDLGDTGGGDKGVGDATTDPLIQGLVDRLPKPDDTLVSRASRGSAEAFEG